MAQPSEVLSRNAENADIAASAGNGKRRAPNAERFLASSDQRRYLIY
jgi:hypothetical protein